LNIPVLTGRSVPLGWFVESLFQDVPLNYDFDVFHDYELFELFWFKLMMMAK